MQLSEWREFNDSLIQTKTPFRVEKTSMSIKFFTPYGEFEFYTVTEDSLPQRELFFIKKVKDYADTLSLEFNVDRENLKYIHLPRMREGYTERGLVEIDLSSAYWNFAREEKIISEELYEVGVSGYKTRKGEHRTISKRTRLASLGALAKLTHFLEFDGHAWNIGEVVEGEKANYFFRVAERTGEVMEELRYLTGADFLCYWVDAIFIRPESDRNVEEYLTEKGLKFKRYEIEKVVSLENSLRIFSEQHRREKDTVKSYRDFYYKRPEQFDLLHKHTKKQKRQNEKNNSIFNAISNVSPLANTQGQENGETNHNSTGDANSRSQIHRTGDETNDTESAPF